MKLFIRNITSEERQYYHHFGNSVKLILLNNLTLNSLTILTLTITLGLNHWFTDAMQKLLMDNVNLLELQKQDMNISQILEQDVKQW
jgi:hypothetical protein